MPGKRFWSAAALLTLLAGAGCCRFCDRWCGERPYGPVSAPPCCVPCTPAPVCCPPGTAPVSAAPGPTWQRSLPNAPCCP
jgi:hypothetical protein